MVLPPLFHWAPSDRCDSILTTGLIPGSRNTVCTDPIPVVCLSPDPFIAWELSGGMQRVEHVQAWDLWRVELADSDEVTIRAEYGPAIREVNVSTSIPPERLWYVARRVRPTGVVRQRRGR